MSLSCVIFKMLFVSKYSDRKVTKIKRSNTQTDKSVNASLTQANEAYHQRNMSISAPETKGARCVNMEPYKNRGNEDKMVTVNEIRGAGATVVTDPETVHDSQGIS